jgi:hypothetical protein
MTESATPEPKVWTQEELDEIKAEAAAIAAWFKDNMED